jgi:hypothetical protein
MFSSIAKFKIGTEGEPPKTGILRKYCSLKKLIFMFFPTTIVKNGNEFKLLN